MVKTDCVTDTNVSVTRCLSVRVGLDVSGWIEKQHQQQGNNKVWAFKRERLTKES